MSKDERIEYLEDERKKIWKRLTEIENKVDKKTSDYEAEARTAAASAQDNSATVQVAAQSIQVLLNEIEKKTGIFEKDHADFLEKYSLVQQSAQHLAEYETQTKSSYDLVKEKGEQVETIVTEAEELIGKKQSIDEKLGKLEEVFKKGDDYDSKLASLYKSIIERKKEIDELYYEVIGYTEKDDDGKETEVKGLKDELQESYDELTQNISEATKGLEVLHTETKKSSDDLSKDISSRFIEMSGKWNDEYKKVLTKIEELLPRALTTGLSSAYSEKKKAEEEESSKHRTSFNYAILGLVIVSLIPFGVSIVSIFQNTDLSEVIIRIPRLVIAILPLYVPVLWVAYSSNRKMNLAKRLIEEYSHKEVLSKTFEGLSKQINSIDDKDISAELRIKLLYNILEVNSENPGKLISDYNKSDHPIMDALEKSVKLTNAVKKLSRLPGMSKLAQILERKSEEILDEQAQRAEAGLEQVIGASVKK